jgi:hypothetical protein
MVGRPRRLFRLNVGGVDVVCLYIRRDICRYDTFPIFAQSQMDREGNRREDGGHNQLA